MSIDDFSGGFDDLTGPELGVPSGTDSTLPDAIAGDAFATGTPERLGATAPAWLQDDTDLGACCCGPAASAATLGFPMPDGSVLQLPADDSDGSGTPDRIRLDLNADGIEDAWAFDDLGTGQVSSMLLDTTGDGVPDSYSRLTATGWSETMPLDPPVTEPVAAQPDPAVAAPHAAAPAAAAAVAPAASPVVPAPTPEPAVAAPLPTPETETDFDRDGRSAAVDYSDRDPYDSMSEDRDNDGTVDAFDGQPTRPFASTTEDRDNDGTRDAFDNEPTQPFTSSELDVDDDGTRDRFDSAPTNPYDAD